MLKSKFKIYLFSKILLNLIVWMFIALGFLVIALLSDKMGLSQISQKPIEGIAPFINSVLTFSTIVGLALMWMFLSLMGGFLKNMRHSLRRKPKMDIIKDDEASEMVSSEILSQLNSLANLSFTICLSHWLDVATHRKPILAISDFDIPPLLRVSFSLYIVAFVVFFATAKLDESPS